MTGRAAVAAAARGLTLAGAVRYYHPLVGRCGRRPGTPPNTR